MRSTATEDGSLPREWAERHGIIASGGRVALLLGVSATLLFFNLGTRVLATNDEAGSRRGMDRMRDPADPGERLIATRLLDLTALAAKSGSRSK